VAIKRHGNDAPAVCPRAQLFDNFAVAAVHAIELPDRHDRRNPVRG
jgi:hypothetical protein